MSVTYRVGPAPRTRTDSPPRAVAVAMPPRQSMFNQAIDLKLIKLVKENPLLYNPRHDKYTDNDSREVVWQQIGDALHRPATQFAGIQCQIQFGDFQEDKHKPGFLENLKEYLPEQYASSWGAEKKILMEYRKHQGLSSLEAKNLYTKTARELPTYGVTFFLVKEKQKDRKKLIPRLLGISAESILRLDEVSKEILQQWPLTHVKTYHAGKGETFTLNFGDYSDKEYCVKTRDAYRIRDILEGYIDLIRKRMLANYNAHSAQHGYITQENISGNTANIIQHVPDNSMKIIEHSFVGPTKIVAYEPGKSINEGTQIVTVQQIVVAGRVGGAQQGIKGGVPSVGDRQFVRRLNKCNSNAVKIVTLLTEPSKGNLEDVRSIVEELNSEMPYIRDGIKSAMDRQKNEEDKRKLEEQLERLERLLKTLADCTAPDTFDLNESTEAAKETADLTTQMFLSLDDGSKRNSRVIKRSHKSFIEDEVSQQNIRRGSLIAAAAAAVHTLQDTQFILTKSYTGPKLDADKIKEIENLSADKIARLNAAIAHYILAHSDPNNIDYSSAVNSMNTINELMPELAKDIQALSSTMDGNGRDQLHQDMKTLCEVVKGLCAAVSAEDVQKVREASDSYAKSSGKLLYVLGKRNKDGNSKEREILDLANAVSSCSSQLISTVRGQLGSVGVNGNMDKLNEALRRVEAATEDFMIQAKMTAPSIDEPHCRSAATAACVSLSSAAALLPAAPCTAGDALHHQLTALNDALQRYRHTYDCFNVEEDDVFKTPSRDQQRMKFITSMSAVKQTLDDAEKQLNDPTPLSSPLECKEAERRLSDRLAQLNATIASLLVAAADKDHPDYKTADLAVSTIQELMPQIIQDAKLASINKPDSECKDMMSQVRSLCEAVRLLCSTEDGNIQDQTEALSKYSDASGKMVYVVSRRVNPDKEQQIIGLTSQACGTASQLLLGVEPLVAAVGGETGDELDTRGAAVADAAQTMLMIAQMNAPSMSDPRCQTAMLSSIDKVSNSVDRLSQAWTPLLPKPELKKQTIELMQYKEQLEEQLNKLRKACQFTVSDPTNVQNIKTPKDQERIKFISTVSAAKKQIQDARQELQMTPPQVTNEQAEVAKKLLAHRLGLLNAAIASLLSATADSENQDYSTAEQAVKTVSDLMPQIAQDALAAGVGMDECSRDEMLRDLNLLCDNVTTLCSGIQTPEGIEAVSKFAESSSRLVYVVSRHVNPHREQQIVELSSQACGTTSQLLLGVQQLVAAVGGETGDELDVRGAAVADAAQTMLNTARVTAASISEPQCKSALLTSVDKVSASGDQLSHAWTPLAEHPQYKNQVLVLQQTQKQLEEQLDKLKKACDLTDEVPSIPSKPVLPQKKPQVPIRKSSTSAAKKPADLTKEFLERIRLEESQHVTYSSPNVQQVKVVNVCQDAKTDDEKRLHQEFITSVDDAQKKILTAEEDLKHMSDTITTCTPVSASETINVQERMQHNLALLGLEVANLVTANYADKIDYSTAAKATTAVPSLMEKVIEDGKVVSSGMSESARQSFMSAILSVCHAARDVCHAAGTERQKLNEAAIVFGDKSAKVLYTISSDVNTDLEKEIISRAKAIGDSASRLAMDVGDVIVGDKRGQHGEQRGLNRDYQESFKEVCASGAACVDAAGKLVYTAKLVAPSIHESPCQEALVSSADNLIRHLQTFTSTWKPFATDPQKKTSIRHLEKEAENLHRIVEGLRSDISGGRIGRREVERLEVEDTPMRVLTMKIIENAKSISSSDMFPAAQRRAHAAHAAGVCAALRALDLATAHCNRSPRDLKKHRELDQCVQNLQTTLFTTRPSKREDLNTNIIDLRDFIEEVSSEAKNLSEVAQQTKVETEHDKKILKEIEIKCNKMSSSAYNLTHTDDTSFDSTYCDILDVDKFGQNCDDLISEIEIALKSIEDHKAKKMMMTRLLPLTESCNVMRFATKSGISSTKCASLESTALELDDIERRLVKVLVVDADTKQHVERRMPAPPAPPVHMPSLCVAPAHVARYAAHCAARLRTDDDKQRLLKHLYKLLDLMKSLTLVSIQRVNTWQSPECPQVADITQQILQEFRKPESKFGETEAQGSRLMDDEDVVKLLVPGEPILIGDAKQHQAQVRAAGTALVEGVEQCMTTPSPPPHAKIRATLAAATSLAQLKRGEKLHKDQAQSDKIEEDIQEMTFITYNLFKTLENADKNTNNPNYKRRLLDTCQSLNESIRKLTCTPDAGLRDHCLSLAQYLRPSDTLSTPTMPYDRTMDALAQEQQVIYRVKYEDSVPASEFRATLHDVTSAVARSTKYASQCAYLLSISEADKTLAIEGVVDVSRLERTLERLQDSCLAVIGASDIHRAKEEYEELQKRADDFSTVLEEAQKLVRDNNAKNKLAKVRSQVLHETQLLQESLQHGANMEKTLSCAVSLLKELDVSHSTVESCPLVPSAGKCSPTTQQQCDEIVTYSKRLTQKTVQLLQAVAEAEDSETMTWTTFSGAGDQLLDAYDALLHTIRVNGQRAGVLEGSEEENSQEVVKSYLDTQVELANKWLLKPTSKAEVKVVGEQAILNVIDIGKKMSEELNVSEGEEMRQVIMETEELMKQCQVKYDAEKYSVLSDRLKELKKLIDRGVVTRVVEDFIDAEEPLQDLGLMVDAEKDASKRKHILERKIAELLAQLGRVTNTARFVATTAGKQQFTDELQKCTQKAELLAPMLVKAAEERIHTNDQEVISKYQALLEEYTQSMCRVRELCDSTVEPMEFVQTAGETMQRLREESTDQTDPQKCAYTSQAIMRLANRTIEVSLARAGGGRDPELAAALRDAQAALRHAAPAGLRPSRLPDWRDTTAQILRTTGEVESALGGENIFKKEPTQSNDQIFSEALKLHQSVREWSSRDNAVVGAARRMAVLMARLAEHVHHDNKQGLISTSKAIVMESNEVATLARKLALECTDVRIRNNLLQTCERIPTISGQLKMLITVKGSSLGHQASEDDMAAMDMLVVNAQSLMISVQEVVKVAAGASVKIMSQRGPKLKWVRKTYY